MALRAENPLLEGFLEKNILKIQNLNSKYTK